MPWPPASSLFPAIYARQCLSILVYVESEQCTLGNPDAARRRYKPLPISHTDEPFWPCIAMHGSKNPSIALRGSGEPAGTAIIRSRRYLIVIFIEELQVRVELPVFAKLRVVIVAGVI